MKKTLKGALALFFCVATMCATLIMVSAIGAPKAKVKSVTYNTVTIYWSKVSGAVGYQVQRSTDGKKWSTLTSSTKEVTYKDSKSLTTGRTYQYRVRAYEGRLIKKYGSWSKVIKAKPVPAKVTGLKASSKTYNSVKLSWSKVSGASGYTVQRYTSGNWKTIAATKSTGYTVKKLTLGKTYNFRVIAYRTVSNKKIYGSASSTLKTGPALSAPSSGVLKGVGTSYVKIAWPEVSGAKGYQVYNYATKKWTTTKTTRSLTVTKLKPGTKYSFIVRAYSGSNKGANSSKRTFITTPSTPTSVKATSTTTTLKVSWKAVTGASGYQVQYSKDGKKWTALSSTSKTYATISKLSSGTKYYIKVRAYVKNSYVKDISSVSYGSYCSTIYAYTVPAAPAAVYLSGVTASSLKVTWSKSTGATSYQIYNPATSKWVSVSTNSYTITGLQAGTKYSNIKVKAVRSSQVSAETKAYSFITAPAAPANLSNGDIIVKDVKFANATTSSIEISWDAVKGAAGYEVQYSASDNSNWTTKTTSATNMIIKSLKAGTTYNVKVRAYVKNSNVSGISATAYSSTAQVQAKTLAVDATIPKITTTSDSTSGIRLTWTASSNATKYVIEKYNYYSGWTVYDFNSNQWKGINGYFSDSSIVATSELTFLDDRDSERRSDVYRIRSVMADGYVSAPSAQVMGTTAGVSVTVGANGQTIISWPHIEGATHYTVTSLAPYSAIQQFTLYRSERDFNVSGSTCSATLYLAPESIHSLTIAGYDSSNNSKGSPTGCINFFTGELSTGTSDVEKNSQVLYLARAINNTKFYKDQITVNSNSKSNYSINALVIKIAGFSIINKDTPEEVQKFFEKYSDEGEAGPLVPDEIENVTFTFKDGSAKTATGQTVRLNNFVGPRNSAYLYNQNKPTALSNGIENLKTVKNSDGSRTISFTLKQETAPNYHSGFITSFAADDLSQLDPSLNLNATDYKIGKSTVSATIDSDGILKSYKVSSPFSVDLSTKMESDKDVNDSGLNISEGDIIEMIISLSSNRSVSYTVTR